MNKLRIGLVGCGPIAQNAHLPAIEKARDIRLQAIADTDAALRESVSLRYCPRSVYKHSDEIFADPNVDLVVLAVGDRFHVPLAMNAVRAGKHVLVEKPLGVRTQECDNFQREERVEIYNAAAKSIFRPDGQDANTFRLQLITRRIKVLPRGKR
jgi:predicted dehydrogenase